MYQAVLAAALMTAGTSPSHCYQRCYGCYGGYVGYAGYAGYSGYSCYGCHGCHRPVYGYGCAGGCYGYHGGCYGGFGVFAGTPYVVGGPGLPYFGQGFSGGDAWHGVPPPVGVGPGSLPPLQDPFPAVKPEGKKKSDAEKVPNPKAKPKTEEEEVRARVTIEIPEGAKLFVDGQPIKTASGMRTFRTPSLKPGQKYYYDFRIEVVRRGEVLSEERRVEIRAGDEAAVHFPSLALTPSVASQTPR